MITQISHTYTFYKEVLKTHSIFIKNLKSLIILRITQNKVNFIQTTDSVNLFHFKNTSRKNELKKGEARNSRVTKSSYETELRKMASHFQLITRKFLQKVLFRVTKSTS